MGARRVVWHVGFEWILRPRGPSTFEVRAEVRLSDEPQRIDYLLVRKRRIQGEARDNRATTLRRLWPILPLVSVVEYKSPGRAYRRGDLYRLWRYVHTYFAGQLALPRHRPDGAPIAAGAPGASEVQEPADLCAVLVVPGRSRALDEDIERMGLAWEDRGEGYWQANGGGFPLHVIEIDVVAPAEGDDLLYSVGHGRLDTPAARWFWMELVGSKEAAMSMQDMEGYDELMQKLLETLPPEQRLAGLPAEEVLARYAPEQRLAGLDRDHQALALPVEVLRLLPEDYLRSLSTEVEAELRRRLRQNGH
jgi:hypothetical protein